MMIIGYSRGRGGERERGAEMAHFVIVRYKCARVISVRKRIACESAKGKRRERERERTKVLLFSVSVDAMKKRKGFTRRLLSCTQTHIHRQ